MTGQAPFNFSHRELSDSLYKAKKVLNMSFGSKQFPNFRDFQSLKMSYNSFIFRPMLLIFLDNFHVGTYLSFDEILGARA